MSIVLEKIISGGQTGADIAALRAVRAYNESNPSSPLQTGGRCPHNYMTANGSNVAELASFHLQEVNQGTLSAQYALRSQLNVQSADATLAFRFKPSVGTDKTISYATIGKWASLKNGLLVCGEIHNSDKPIFVITTLTTDHDVLIETLAAFLIKHQARTLNVCGHRDKCYERDIYNFMQSAFRKFFQKINK
jgi:hypothetical protein